MWQRFTERARRVVFFAQEEAGRLGENYISTEHLLLGLVRESDSFAAQILDQLGMSPGRVRSEIERQVTRSESRLGQDMQLSPRAKRVIDLAYDEARQLKNEFIGTEHILLGLILEREGLAARVLARLGLDVDMVRAKVRSYQAEKPRSDKAGSEGASQPDVTALFSVMTDGLGLRGTSLLSMADLSERHISAILDLAELIEQCHDARRFAFRWNYPRSLAMIFEKPSLRTRVSFELGMQQLGGLTAALGPQEIGLGTRETIPDVARNLERMVDGIMARVFEHHKLEVLRDSCGIPVINGLSDREHPCQCLADLYTIRQKRGTLDGLKLAWVGDGNNVLHSLLLGCATVGMSVCAACPPGYEPDADIVAQAREIAAGRSPAPEIAVVTEPAEAVAGADAVYTDVWTSMGQEQEMIERVRAFRRYQVNSELMAQAKPDALFMHCLPAHRGDEVTDEVVDGPQSVVFDQAENRLHAQKAILALLIGP